MIFSQTEKIGGRLRCAWRTWKCKNVWLDKQGEDKWWKTEVGHIQPAGLDGT